MVFPRSKIGVSSMVILIMMMAVLSIVIASVIDQHETTTQGLRQQSTITQGIHQSKFSPSRIQWYQGDDDDSNETTTTPFYLNHENYLKYYNNDSGNNMVDYAQPLLDITVFFASLPTCKNKNMKNCTPSLFSDPANKEAEEGLTTFFESGSTSSNDDDDDDSDSTIEVVHDIIENGDELLDERDVHELLLAAEPSLATTTLTQTVISVNENQQIVREIKTYDENDEDDEEDRSVVTQTEILGSTSVQVQAISSVRHLMGNNLKFMHDNDDNDSEQGVKKQKNNNNNAALVKKLTVQQLPQKKAVVTIITNQKSYTTTAAPPTIVSASPPTVQLKNSNSNQSSPSGVKTVLNLKAAAALIKSIVEPILKSYENKSFSIPKTTSARLGNVIIHALDLRSNTDGVITASLDASIGFVVTKKFWILGTARITGAFQHLKISISSSLTLIKSTSRLALNNFRTTGGVDKFEYKVGGKIFAKLLTKIGLAIIKFKSLLTNIANKDIPVGIQAALLAVADKIAVSVPTKLPLTRGIVAPTNPLSTMTMVTKMTELTFPHPNVVLVGFDGGIVDGKTMKPYSNVKVYPTHSPTLPINPQHLFQAMLDQSVFNNIFATWFGLLPNNGNSIIFVKQSQPKWLLTLTTSVWNTIFPGIGEQYPHSDLLMIVSFAQQPLVEFKPDNSAQVLIQAKVEWFVVDVATTTTTTGTTATTTTTKKLKLIEIDIKLTVGLHFFTEYNQSTRITSLKATMTQFTPVFSVVSSLINGGKPIQLTLINGVLQLIIDNVILPQINAVLNDNGGIPIPTTPKLVLKSPTVSFLQHGIVIGTGVAVLEL